MGAEKQYIDLYEQCEVAICQHSAPAMNALRTRAFSDFKRLGLPTRKLEKYKYTDMSKLFEPDYGININRVNLPVQSKELFQCGVLDMDCRTSFVVNDSFLTEDLTKQPLPEGVWIGSLKQAALDYPELVEAHYGRLAETQADGITAFNTAFAQDGVFMHVSRGVKVEKPVQLINLLRGSGHFMVNRRVLIVLDEGAQLRLLSCDHTLDMADFLATQVIEVFVGRQATFDFYELEENHMQTIRVSNLYVRQEADSNVLLNGMTISNGLTRNHTKVVLAGEGADLQLYGMAVADKEQVVDNNTMIEHAVPHCTSRQLYKYVLDDRAQGAFAGLVKVSPGAHHTSSEQLNRNLCATRGAHMYSQPQLEIYNDDVKCSHGATVGQLDENALFYMRQRGISLKEARLLLMFAFVNEVVQHVRIDALRDRLFLLVERRFRGEAEHNCRGCDICRK